MEENIKKIRKIWQKNFKNYIISLIKRLETREKHQ